MAGKLLVCRRCHRPNGDDAHHCSACGAALRDAVRVGSAASFDNAEGQAWHHSLARRHRRQSLIIAAIVIGCVQMILTVMSTGTATPALAHLVLTGLVTLAGLSPRGGHLPATALGALGTVTIWGTWGNIVLLTWLLPMTGLYTYLGISAGQTRDLTR